MNASAIGLLLHYRDAMHSIRCIRSLLDQGLSPVVVWDNSADNGVSAVAIRQAFIGDARIDINVSDANLGFAAGVNRGLQRCARLRPESWVLLINNDARLLPGACSGLAQALAAHPLARIAFPDIDQAGRVLGQAYCHRLTGLLSWRPHPGSFAYPGGCCLLIATDRIAGPLFDEDFFMYGEDCELGWRLGRYPGSMIHVGQILVEHEGTASSGLGSPFYETHMVAAHLILARKLARNPLDACVLHVLRASMLLARALLRSIRFRSFTPCRALWAGARLAFGKHRLR